MKQILVVADTHGNVENLNRLIKNTEHDYLFFLGDLLHDVKHIKGKNVFKVRGNWDINIACPLKKVVEIEGVKFLLTHGFGYGTRKSTDGILKLGKKHSANVVCFGHSHAQCNKQIDGITLINPGAFSFSKEGEQTYSVIIVDNGKFCVNMFKF